MLGEDFAAVLAGVFDQVAHAVGLVHLLRSAGVVAGVAGVDRLGLVDLEVVFLDFTHSSLDAFLTDLTLPQLTRPSAHQHLVDHGILAFADVLLQFDPFGRRELFVDFSLQKGNGEGELFVPQSVLHFFVLRFSVARLVSRCHHVFKFVFGEIRIFFRTVIFRFELVFTFGFRIFNSQVSERNRSFQLRFVIGHGSVLNKFLDQLGKVIRNTL